MEFAVGRLCADLLAQHPNKEGACWDGRREGGGTPPLGMPLTKVTEGYVTFHERKQCDLAFAECAIS